MSGHSKWSNIKRKKGVEDVKKGKLFSKLARDIMIAAREGGGDVDSNSALRKAVEKAKENSMPKFNIDRAVSRGAGTLEGQQVVEAIYEGYGPGGAAIMIKCLTDNKNRTVSEVRYVFTRAGYSLADAGSVAYIFNTKDRTPLFKVDLSESDAEKFIDLCNSLKELDDVIEIRHNANIELEKDEE